MPGTRMLWRWCVGIALGFACWTDGLQAGETKAVDPYELTLEQLGNTVITASKAPQAASKVTQKVDVITEQQINQIYLANRNISELIQYLTGASVRVLSRNDANWGAYGGIGPKYSTYMVQGLPIDGFMDPMNIDPVVIQRIEVQRGPASILYSDYLSQDFAGNQSPFAGTVNLILKETVSKPQTSITVDYGSYNTFESRIFHQNRFGRLSFFGGVSYEISDYTDYGSTNSWLNMLKDPEYQKLKAFLGASVYLDGEEKHKISVFANQTFHWGDFGRVNRNYDNLYGLLNAEYSGQLTDAVKVGLKSGVRHYDRSWQEDDYNVNHNQALRETDGVRQTIVPVDASVSLRHWKESTLTVGSDFQQASYSTWAQPAGRSKEEQTDGTATQTGFYVQEELQLGNVTLRGGGRFNLNSEDIEKSGGLVPATKNQDWQAALWSAGAKYRFARGWDVFANAGNSFLPPGFKSIAGTIPMSDAFVPGRNGQLPNPGLKPENGVAFDVGIDGTVVSNLNVSVRVFMSTITDAIIDNVVSENPSQAMSVNAGRTESRGIEMSLQQHFDFGIDWFANITLTKSEIVDHSNPDQDGSEVPFVPGVVGNLGITLYLPGRIQVSPMLHWSGSIFDSSSKAHRNSFDMGEVFNLIISKEFEFKKDRSLTVFVKLYNLTDNKFDMPWQFRDPGFQGTLGLTMRF
jgi:outer membrane receptor protein involved in Fe transport